MKIFFILLSIASIWLLSPVEASGESSLNDDTLKFDLEDVNIKDLITLNKHFRLRFDEPAEEFDFEYPLVLATEGSSLDAIKFLIANGADPNAGVKKTPLAIAVEQGDRDVVRLLLALGADPSVLSGDGLFRHPILLAIFMDDMETLQLLLKKTKAINFVDKEFSPLSAAAFYGRRDMVEALLLAGAQPNVAGNDGETALHKVAYFDDPKHLEIAKLLVYAGADPGAKNADGVSPADRAWRESGLPPAAHGVRPVGMANYLAHHQPLHKRDPAMEKPRGRKSRLTLSMDNLRRTKPSAGQSRQSSQPDVLPKSK